MPGGVTSKGSTRPDGPGRRTRTSRRKRLRGCRAPRSGPSTMNRRRFKLRIPNPTRTAALRIREGDRPVSMVPRRYSIAERLGNMWDTSDQRRDRGMASATNGSRWSATRLITASRRMHPRKSIGSIANGLRWWATRVITATRRTHPRTPTGSTRKSRTLCLRSRPPGSMGPPFRSNSNRRRRRATLRRPWSHDSALPRPVALDREHPPRAAALDSNAPTAEPEGRSGGIATPPAGLPDDRRPGRPRVRSGLTPVPHHESESQYFSLVKTAKTR